jgi:hypothetical protein
MIFIKQMLISFYFITILDKNSFLLCFILNLLYLLFRTVHDNVAFFQKFFIPLASLPLSLVALLLATIPLSQQSSTSCPYLPQLWYSPLSFVGKGGKFSPLRFSTLWYSCSDLGFQFVEFNMIGPSNKFDYTHQDTYQHCVLCLSYPASHL